MDDEDVLLLESAATAVPANAGADVGGPAAAEAAEAANK